MNELQAREEYLLTIMKLLNILWLCLLSLLTLLPMYDLMFVVAVVLSRIAIQAIRNIVSLSGCMCGCVCVCVYSCVFMHICVLCIVFQLCSLWLDLGFRNVLCDASTLLYGHPS